MNGGEIRILVLLPYYNNAATVAETAAGILALGRPVLAINDGSTDGGPDSLRSLPLERLDFPRNRGKGRALRAGLRWAKERGYSHVVSIDADGQHSPADIERLAEKVRTAPDRMIVGRRGFGSDAPGASRFGRRWSNMWVRIASGGRTPDSQSGFRAYPVEPLAGLKYLGSRYEFEVEVLVRAVWAGLELDWVDVETRYDPPSGRVSHFRPFLDNFRISLVYTALVTRNLIPLPFRRRVPRTSSGPAGTPSGGQTRLEKAWAGWLGAVPAALPLLFLMAPTVRLYARRFGLDARTALAVNRWGAPWIRPAAALAAVESGYFIHHQRFLGPADVPDWAAAGRVFGREIAARLGDWVSGGFWLGLLAGGIVFLILFARHHERP
ncbi:MAG: glycosyltransferase family 2 protein [Acidobacteriota bacterium]|nr:glycosyltransferase family 2 protein [Acidobacteriota bacterium]